MSYWQINFMYGKKKSKHKIYASEKAFENNWKYHCDFCDYLHSMSLDQHLVALKDGKEIRRHPK